MFSVSKQLLRPKYLSLGIRRGFASQCIYVSNLSEGTTAETLRSKFEPFGTIAGVRINRGTRSYKYAHVYFMSGNPPMINGDIQPMVEMNPTLEESRIVKEAIDKSVEAFDETELDGNIIYVKSSATKPIRTNRSQENKQDMVVVREKSYKAGFADGYSRGYSDAVGSKL
ncbi:hypothetical protein LPJ64_001445 [Coemansia asiatica]|uniref:RRM domain-containing protein n=1 Tax=Coemansia asiatica TaxID=1052880 RepID=A0A9W8CLW3_9FUNG|nr:hypothetical protein LPJ64_001445 [Coemansia asiatica]